MTIASGLGLLGCGMIVTMVFWFVLSKAFEYGIDIIRVHDVREHIDLFSVLEKMEE